jgi:hypothetical protein
MASALRHDSAAIVERPESDCALDLTEEISEFTQINDIMKRLSLAAALGDVAGWIGQLISWCRAKARLRRIHYRFGKILEPEW